MPDTDRFNAGVSDGKAVAEPIAEPGTGDTPDEKLLIKIREDYKFCLDYWKENRDEGAEDMTFVANTPWTREEKDRRKGRPCVVWDEISQYLKQANNNQRQAATSIKVLPRGDGATDADALKRAAIIRGIEYQSNAQAAYTTAYEGATSCFMGAFRITTKQMPGGSGFAVEPRIKRIPNPFTVLLDPEANESDFSDQNICFVTDVLRKSTFAEKYPRAQKHSFAAEDEKIAPDWFRGESIVVAEYWVRTAKARKKLRVKGKAGEVGVFEDELPEGAKPEVLDSRDITEHKVMQYITNGVEILERREWPGSWIPIIPVLGEEIFTSDGGMSKRIFMSLVRRARGPQKSLNYLASQELEEFAMAPRSPLLLWEGQEDADKEALKNLNQEPRAYIRLKRISGADGQLVADLPAGGRLPFQPNAEAYEIAREAARRAIQAAMGISPLPTPAQQQNEKSGIALERIQTAEAVGSFHFTDNLNRAKENCGRQLNELITKVMDTPRHVGIRNADDSHGLLRVMAEEHAPQMQPQQQQANGEMGESQGDGQLDYLIVDRGEFDVTMSTGASYESQREQNNDFADTLLKTLEPLAQLLPPGAATKLIALAIKLKDIGAIGDKMAAVIDPPQDTGAQLAQAQQQAQQSQLVMAEMKAELEKLKLEKAGKVIDNEYKMQFEKMRISLEAGIAQLNADLKAYIANVQTKAQDAQQRNQLFQETQVENHHAAHEVALQKDQQAHDRGMAANAAATQAASQAADQQHQQAMAAQSETPSNSAP